MQRWFWLMAPADGWEVPAGAQRAMSAGAEKQPMHAVLVQRLLESGIKSIAVLFKHAAIFPEHEEAVGRVAREVGFTQISLSSEVMQMVKLVPRGFTATADAYLTPHIMR